VLSVDLIGQGVSVEVDAADVRPRWNGRQGARCRAQEARGARTL